MIKDDITIKTLKENIVKKDGEINHFYEEIQKLKKDLILYQMQVRSKRFNK